ncbi:MAG: RIP metalloprotease RseP [Deltaproteobacteria bacterium]|nr:MAG: RIP metalloprotease RseP [Deltaproteobacteria bacterium]TMB36770.1 MAG: RIP metalloprotease RseP [Deltaproteobacteria bacterium]
MAFVQSAGFTLLSFALVISVVVFFHELGHLLVGKAVGVKAIRFSIGFGPRLFGFTAGETEYRVSLLPLGGYVKFAGDNPYEEVAPQDRGRGFLEQPPWKKGVIAFAGPAANFALAVALYFVVFAAPHQDLAAKVGYVKPQSPAAQAGLRSGDRIVRIDGEPVEGWSALQEKIRAHAGQPLTMEVERNDARETLRIVPAVHEETNPIETVKHGRIGISAVPRAAQVTVISPDLPAARAGLHTFDKVVKLDGSPIASWEQLQQQIAARADAVTLDLIRPLPVQAPGGTLWSDKPMTVTLPAPEKAGAYGLEPSDLTLFAVQPGGAADEAGLRRGDRVLAVNGRPAFSWGDEVDGAIKAAGTQPLQITVRRDGKELIATVTPHLRKDRDETGVLQDVPDLGAAPDLNAFADAERIWVRYTLPDAARRAVGNTAGFVRAQTIGIVRIVTGHISSRAIGGPLMIADVARKAAENGWRELIVTMGAISVVLGLMNLIPVPVLDGFHVLTAFIEGIRRRPLSVRFREVANVVGIALLLTLMLYAFRNDAMRKWFE